MQESLYGLPAGEVHEWNPRYYQSATAAATLRSRSSFIGLKRPWDSGLYVILGPMVFAQCATVIAGSGTNGQPVFVDLPVPLYMPASINGVASSDQVVGMYWFDRSGGVMSNGFVTVSDGLTGVWRPGGATVDGGFTAAGLTAGDSVSMNLSYMHTRV